ncbi:tRNA (adenine(22)-N(1))-methyltransferase [Halobacillus naozhouensis]|uniref:Class I SAM-dependent methyltransferase n=1 Tax=Halobacillus naozhouensis TaxID=554880 RepID=A0ABY8IVE1_9BACI|nr:class I SAM-dependent methyltransferase [Halobacillus naozhouensis]WFT73279.1 class I SAM-dependent methyltransferase [Halobacillus naozhouensis]
MKVTRLSERLAKVAEYLPKGACFADIGSDHAYLPCYVCLHDHKASAVAGEVNKGPYQSAVEEVYSHELAGRIDVRLGDGLNVLKADEVKQVVIAGMGGPLIRDILENGKDKLGRVSRIIVQPNIDARTIRQWFYENRFCLVQETILEENGHIYEVLVAERGEPGKNYDHQNLQKQLWLGPLLLKENNSVFKKKWKQEKSKKENILKQISGSKQPDEEKMRRFQFELEWIKEALEQ